MSIFPIKCTINTIVVGGLIIGILIESREPTIGNEHTPDDYRLSTLEYRYNAAALAGTTISTITIESRGFYKV